MNDVMSCSLQFFQMLPNVLALEWCLAGVVMNKPARRANSNSTTFMLSELVRDRAVLSSSSPKPKLFQSQIQTINFWLILIINFNNT